MRYQGFDGLLIPFRKNSTVCWKTWARKKIYKCRKNARRRTRTPSGNPKHETWSHSHKTFSSGIGGLRQSLTPFGVIGCNESSRKVPSNATSAIQVDFQDTMVAFKGTKLLWRWFLFLSNLHPLFSRRLHQLAYDGFKPTGNINDRRPKRIQPKFRSPRRFISGIWWWRDTTVPCKSPRVHFHI